VKSENEDEKKHKKKRVKREKDEKKKPKESKPKKVLDKCATLLKSTKEKLKQYASTVSKQESTISISKIKTSTVKSTKIEKKDNKKMHYP